MDRIRSLLIALLVGGGISTLVAESSNDAYQTAYLLKIRVPGIPWQISAFSIYEPDGPLKEIDYVPSLNFPRFSTGVEAEVGYGHWSQEANGVFVVNYKTQLPKGQVREVHASLSASGNELTGSATVKLINQDGSVEETRNVTVTGVRASKRLVAKPST
jgi:hypothetical protein